MKGNYFLGSRQFQVREMSFPPLGDFEVKIQNMAAGICGTDIHIYHGEKGSAEVTPPVVLGHEYAGVVVETGRGVTTVRTGDHVTVDPNIYCGTCPYCKAGKKQLCSNLVAVGVNFDGGFAQYSVVPPLWVRLCSVLPHFLSVLLFKQTGPISEERIRRSCTVMSCFKNFQ